ncbi:DMT family transporter [Pelagerythrobacter aerophilus]|nr:DMT family transporter [Pelagerythrobacter aerophilus]
MLSSPATNQLPAFSCLPCLTRDQEGYIWGAIAALIWGGFFAYSRLGIEAGLNAADLAFLRYGTAGALMLPWLLRRDVRSLGGVGWLRGAVFALLAGPLFVLVSAAGFAFAPLAHGAVIQLGTVTLMGTVLARAFLDERVGIMRAIGLAVIVAGLAITVGPGLLDGGSQAWKGDLLFAGAGLMWALFTLLQHRWSADPMATTAAISVLSLLVYAPAYLLIRGPQALIAAGPFMVMEFAIVLGVFSGIVSLFAFGRAVSCLGAARASLFPALAPGVAILLGVPLAGEMPTLTQVAGVVVLTAGLMLSIRQRSAG